jgi:hypothetical protein
MTESRRESVMSRTALHKNTWRLIAIVSLAVSLSGPWVFDRIAVPAPHECTAPWVRLTDDLCGIPVSPVGFILEQIQYTPSLASLFPFLLLPLALAIPIITTLVLILLKEFKPWKIVHIVVLILLTATGIFYVYSAIGSTAQAALWGVWLYLITLLILLVLEIVTLRIRSRHDRADQVSA